MNVRELLLQDQGIDVRIASGSGQRADPYIVEACSVNTCERTQLDLVRGLQHGLHRLWKVIECVPAAEISPKGQCLRIKSIAFTPTEIITETIGVYFDCRQVDGAPQPKGDFIVWSDQLDPPQRSLDWIGSRPTFCPP